jgi:hypothetical protein
MAWVRAKYENVREEIKPGDVIAFGGKRGFFGHIKWWADSTVDHVAVILQSDLPGDDESHLKKSHQIIESTAFIDNSSGVNVRRLGERIEGHDGEIWWLPFDEKSSHKLDLDTFSNFLHQHIGRPYDPLQEVRSAPDAVDTVPFIGRLTRSKEDFSRFFGSELVAAGLEAGGVIGSLNASEVTPTDLCNFSIYQEKYYQLKGSKKLINGFNTLDPEGWGEQVEPLSIKKMIIRYPAFLWLIISATLLMILLLQEILLNRFPVIFGPMGTVRDFRIAIVHCLLAGYLPSACLYLLNGTQNTFAELSNVLKPVDDSTYKYSFSHIRRGRFFIWGLIGLLLTVFTPILTSETPAWDPATWQPEVWWHRILGLFIGWWLGWFVLIVWDMSTQTSRLASRIGTVDLLDLSPLSPFVKQGLLTSLLVVGALSLSSLFLLEPGQWPVVVITVGISLPLAILGLVLPLRGVHQRIREAKQVELEWIRENIRQFRITLPNNSVGGSSGQVADWITYLQLIADVPEWPIESSTLVRVILYMLIPIVSWIGSLLIEGVLDKLFG